MSIKITVKDLLNLSLAKQLNSTLESQILLAHVLGVDRACLYTSSSNSITQAQQEHFESLILRRAKGEPIAYLIGKKEFWSLPLEISNNVLIPRPETELLVEVTLKYCSKAHFPYEILELGTGSGAISLAIAKELPEVKIYAVDKSKQALEVAQKNAKNLTLNSIHFIESDWFSYFDSFSKASLLDVIVSNPPYLCPNDPHLITEDIRFEPVEALVSYPDGLGAIRHIIHQGFYYLKAGGALLLEHGYNQGEEIVKLMEKEGYKNIQGFRDLARINRVTMGSKL